MSYHSKAMEEKTHLMPVLEDESLVIHDLVDDGLEHDLLYASGELRVDSKQSAPFFAFSNRACGAP